MGSEFLTKLTMGAVTSPSDELMDTTNPSTVDSGNNPNSVSPSRHVCVVCGDESGFFIGIFE
jgi:hypothetical protein